MENGGRMGKKKKESDMSSSVVFVCLFLVFDFWLYIYLIWMVWDGMLLG